MNKKSKCLGLVFFLTACVLVSAQEKHYYQTEFSKEEFAERRAKIFEKIGKNAIAVIQGAKGTADFNVFRQTNEFYYLSGIETPHAYLILDGRNQKTTIYLSHRDADRERNEGKMFSVEDADLIKELTGIDNVRGVEFLSQD
nr:aminopeptidase P N-terminal domain-containing protein [Pyrinomonadaceae bacterium]